MHGNQVQLVASISEKAGSRITLLGDLDITARETLRAALATLRCTDADLHVDLSQVTFVDVSNLAALTSASNALPDGRRMYLHSPPDQVCRALAVLWPTLNRLEVVSHGRTM